MNYNVFDTAEKHGAFSVQETALQRSFINRVFGWMSIGLAITGFTAYFTAVKYGTFIAANQSLFLILLIVEFVAVLALSASIRFISPTVALAGFVFFSALNGVTMSWIFMVYSMQSVTTTFLCTSLTFGAMGLYGWLTKRDLSRLGSLASMLLIGLIIASVVNIFLRNRMFDFIVSFVGVAVFVGLTAFDVQKIKVMALVQTGDGESRKLAVFGALTLYLDFINLFLYLLRFFGNRR